MITVVISPPVNRPSAKISKSFTAIDTPFTKTEFLQVHVWLHYSLNCLVNQDFRNNILTNIHKNCTELHEQATAHMSTRECWLVWWSIRPLRRGLRSWSCTPSDHRCATSFDGCLHSPTILLIVKLSDERWSPNRRAFCDWSQTAQSATISWPF
jgi:hypothetical protein